jgi:hypothetical protein
LWTFYERSETEREFATRKIESKIEREKAEKSERQKEREERERTQE